MSNDRMMPTLDVNGAATCLQTIVRRTELFFHPRLSKKYHCNIYLKREDQQPVRSYKIRGAYNKINSLSKEERAHGIVCASAGNHAQGVAYSCHHLGIDGIIYMPANTPEQKIERVNTLGGNEVKIILFGESYDEAATAALQFAKENQRSFIHPFDDEKVIEGQATIAKEILEDLEPVDYLFFPIGGGGLAAGLGYYFHLHSPTTILVGAEPVGAASMTAALEAGQPVNIAKIDPFVDGAAVRKVGSNSFNICKATINHVQTVAEGKVCSVLLQLYNEDGILAEPAGVLSIAALDDYADVIKGKNVVCVLSGSNNDSNRMDDIKKLALAWEGLQHHLVIRFHHNPDGLKEFFANILGPNDYVNRIEYLRRDHGRSTYALVGIRSNSQDDYKALTSRLTDSGTEYNEVVKEDFLFKYWV